MYFFVQRKNTVEQDEIEIPDYISEKYKGDNQQPSKRRISFKV